MQTNYTLGKFIHQKRTSAKLSQAQLARIVGWTSPQFLSNIERDEAAIPPNKVLKLAKALNTNPDEFIKRHLAGYADYYRNLVMSSTPRRLNGGTTVTNPSPIKKRRTATAKKFKKK